MAEDLITKRKQALVSRFEAERERVAQRYDLQFKSLERRKEADMTLSFLSCTVLTIFNLWR